MKRMKLAALPNAVTCTLDGLYTGPEMKLYIFLPRLNSAWQWNLILEKELASQVRSRKSDSRYANCKKPRQFSDVWKETLACKGSSTGGFFSRLAASRRSKAHREALNEDVQAEQEEQERRAVLEEVATHLGPKHPICYDSYCLCDLSHEKKLETFSVAMLKDMLKYFEIPFSSGDRKKNLVANVFEFLDGCDCNQPH